MLCFLLYASEVGADPEHISVMYMTSYLLHVSYHTCTVHVVQTIAYTTATLPNQVANEVAKPLW